MINPGLKIAELRAKKGWTQAELCRRSGLAQANLSNIEKGKKDFTVSTLLRLAAALETEASELLREDAKPKRAGFSRREIETLALAVLDPSFKGPEGLKAEAELLRKCFFPANGRSLKIREAEQAWYSVRKRYTENELKEIRRRVDDARMRRNAKTAD